MTEPPTTDSEAAAGFPLLPIHEPATVGDLLSVELWHTGLDAAEEAEAHAAIVLGDEVLWEAFVDIPDDARVWSLELELPADVPRGELLGLHLHNHGDNVWKLGPVLVSR